MSRLLHCTAHHQGSALVWLKSATQAARTAPWRLRSALVAGLLLAAAGVHAQNVFPAQAVGSASAEQSVTVTSTSGGTVANVEVLTVGVSGQDFAAGLGASNCPNNTLAANGSCTEYVTFTPTEPGQRLGAVVLLDSNKKVLGTAYISGTGLGGLGVLLPGNMIPVAGQYGYFTEVDDGVQATQSQLYMPASVALDAAGNMYIADSQHNRIRMVCSANPPAWVTTCTGKGIIITIAGNGAGTYTGDGGIATSATVSNPTGVALDGAGNLYIADTGNNVIRVINGVTGVITTFAGNSSGTICATGSTDAVGDGCAATQSTLNQPQGVTLDGSGNLYIADTYNNRIRAVSATTGIITTIAGSGYIGPDGFGGFSGDNGLATSAKLNRPYAVAFDSQGNMYIPDSQNNRIREVMEQGGSITPASTITTFAGTGTAGYSGDNGAATAAQLFAPSGVAIDAAGNVYIADTQNAAIRKVSATTKFITTLLENNVQTYYRNNSFGKVGLYGLTGLFLDGAGDLYVADTLDMEIREVQGNFAGLDYTTAVRQGSKSSPINQTVENDGNAPLDLTVLTQGTNTFIDPTTNCTTGPPYLSVNATCTIAADFAPTVAGNPLTGDITVAEDTQPGPPEVTAPNSPLTIELVGNALAVNSTTTTVTSSSNLSNYGQAVTFTVNVVTGANTGSLMGTVSITDTYNGNTVTLASKLPLTVNAAGDSGTATFPISTLGVGLHTIVASYDNTNDPAHYSSSSTDNGMPPLIQTVDEQTITTLASSANPSTVGQNVTFTATVGISAAGGGVTPDGTVTFSWGTTSQTVPLTAGQATYSTSALPNGVTTVTASYSGDSGNEILGSQATVSQDVQAPATISVAPNPPQSNYGQAITFTATVTSTATQPATGKVTFLDSGTQIGTGTLSGNPATATFTTASLPVGTHLITVSYAGDSYNSVATSSPPISVVVSQTQTTTTVTSATPNPGIAGTPETITATVQIVAGSATLGGTVTFTNGTSVLGTAPVKSGGTATITPSLPAGTYSIVATYSGDSNDEGSASAAYPLTVVLGTTTTSISVSPSSPLVDQAITFTTKVTSNGVTPTGTVTFMNGTATLGTATLNGGTASYTDTAGLPAGSYTITAVYSDDANNAASTSSPYTLTVGTIPTETDLGSSTTSGSNPQVILVATVLNGATGPMPQGQVTFNSGSTVLGTATLDSSGVATLVPNLTAGINYTITASYGGDSTHSPSTSQPITVSGTATGFSLAVTPNTLSLSASQNATVAVSLTSNGGFTDTIEFGCGSLPAGMTCHFSPLSASLPANGQASTQLTIDTNNPLSGGSTAMNRPAGGRGNLALAGLLLPFSAFFGWLFWRLRRRNGSILAMVLLLALSAGALLASGCSGISMGGVAPGTYTIQVIGTGQNSNVIHYQNVTVNVTK